MAATVFLLQTPNMNSSPARTLRDGVSAMAINAESAADARALAKAQFSDDVDATWDNADVTTPAAAADMTGWKFRVRIISPLGVQVADETVEADAVAEVIVPQALAVATFTGTGNLADGDALAIGGKTYALQDTLTNVANNVKVGTDLATTLANVAAAINAGAGSGTAYAAATTANANVTATSTATTLVVTSKDSLTAAEANALTAVYTPASTSYGSVDHSPLTGGVDEVQATDTPSALAVKMVAALSAGTIDGAGFVNSTHTLTLADADDVLGDHRVFAYFIPAGADADELIGIPGFIGTGYTAGSPSSPVTLVLAADSHVVPVVTALLGEIVS